MSNATQKADQIAYRFYTKLASVLNHARATGDPKTPLKLDKWFNLETPDSDLFKEHLRIYRSVSAAPLPPPLELQVRLVVPPELNHNQVLVHFSPDMTRLRIEPTPRYIVLESWLLSFIPTPNHGQEVLDIPPSTIYKHGIPLFRSLYSLLRIIPAWKYSRRLRRRTGGSNRNSNLTIELAIPSSQEDPESILRFHTAPARNAVPLPTETHQFPSVPHPTGTLSLSVTYLNSPNFQLDELESLLSSRFLSLDAGPDFTPTLAKNQPQRSVTGSSLPVVRPVSPASSLADRFVLPTRVASLGVSPRNVPLPIARSSSAAAPGESPSGHSAGSSAWSKEELRPPSGLAAARLRKESLGRGGDLPSAPSPLPIRRLNINPVHPFKSSTLSSGSPSHHSPSPSLRQGSPLSAPAHVPGGGQQRTGVGMPAPASPSTSSRVPLPSLVNRPSPSSLGDRRSVASATSAEGGEGAGGSGAPIAAVALPRKRYSSSFGHRYAGSGGAGSEGSAGSGERERERVVSGLMLSTDDDDISMFMQEIDSRKPLSRRHRMSVEGEGEGERDGLGVESHRGMGGGGGGGRMEALEPRRHVVGMGSGSPGDGRSEEGSESSRSRSRNWRRGVVGDGEGHNGESGSRGGREPMLTSESDVDERLRRMNMAFLASLEGLETRRERQQQGQEQQEHREQRQVGEGGTSGMSSRSGRMLGAYHHRHREGALGENVLQLQLQSPRDGTGSGSTSVSASSTGLGQVQGSDEVIGRLELDERR